MTETPSAVRKCPECGHTQSAEFNICRNCGNHFAASEINRPKSPHSPASHPPVPADAPAPEDPQPLLQLVKPLIFGLLVAATAIVVFWPTIAGLRSAADADLRGDIEAWLQTRPGLRQWKVRVDDGVCRIDFGTPILITEAVTLAGDTAVRCSQFAQLKGEHGLGFAEVSYVGNKLAEAKAARGALLRTRSVTVIPVDLMVPVAKSSTAFGMRRSGWFLIVLIWTLLALFAVLLWRVVR